MKFSRVFFRTLTYGTDGGVPRAANRTSRLEDFVTDIQVETRVGVCGVSIYYLPVPADIRPCRDTWQLSDAARTTDRGRLKTIILRQEYL